MSSRGSINTMFHHVFDREFPLWAFLNQRVFDPDAKLILNPSEFQKQHRIERLERCWNLTCHGQNKNPYP